MRNFAKIIIVILLLPISIISATEEPVGKKRMFSITGYYSPLPTQSFFLTGSYESEIRLNGNGKVGADGVSVFPGMMAAPPNYEFGTKICIPKFGCGEVHDRGQAIVNKGNRSIAHHDRIDLWMGYGDSGLRRALEWGLQHLEGEIFDKNAKIENSVNFNIPSSFLEILQFEKVPKFAKNLGLKNTGSDVRELQEFLQKLNFYDGKIDEIYSKNLQKSVLQFQKKYFVIENENSLGAGRFGPKTRSKLLEIIYKNLIQEKIIEVWQEFNFSKNQALGKRNNDVLKLQKILVKEELMEVSPTGFFGSITVEALKKFQLKYEIITSKNAKGAGSLGPKTREKLNQIINQKSLKIQNEKSQILAFQKNRNTTLAFGFSKDRKKIN